jgi:hypothetical protein
MVGILKQHLQPQQTRRDPPPMDQRAGSDQRFYMSGANGPGQRDYDRSRAQDIGNAGLPANEPCIIASDQISDDTLVQRRDRHQAHPPSRMPYQHDPLPQQAYQHDPPLPHRRTVPRQGENLMPQEPYVIGQRTSLPTYRGTQEYRGLTPQEMKMADDNARVKAMGGSLKFQAEQIGYFWPDMPRGIHPEDVTEVNGKTCYRNVRDFIDAAKLCIVGQSMPEHTVRNNLHQCFKGVALLWYQSNLGLERRMEVLGGNGLDNWEDKLKHFRVQPQIAIARLAKEKYGPQDLCTGKSPAEWFLKVKRLCQDAGYVHDNDNQYVIHAWNLLSPKIRVHLQNPGSTMTSDEFLFSLEEKKYELIDVFKNEYAPGKFPSNRQNGSNGGHQNGYQPYGNRNRDTRQAGSSAPPNQSNYNGANANGNSDTRPQQSANGNANYRNQRNAYGSNSQDSRASGSQGRGSAQPGRQQRQYSQVQGAYLTQAVDSSHPGDATQQAIETPSSSEGIIPEEDRISVDSGDYSPRNWATQDDDAGDQQQEDTQNYYDTEDDDDDYHVYNVDYTTKSAIAEPRRAVCLHCKRRFPSANKMHNHLRQEHNSGRTHNVHDAGDIEVTAVAYTAGFVQPGQKEPIAVTPKVRLIKSTAPPPVDGATTVFRNWHELKLIIRAKRDGQDMTVIPDTGASLTLGNKTFIKDNFPNAKWETLEKPIHYKGAGPGMTEVQEVAYITIYVPSRVKSGEQVCTLWRLRVNIVPKLGPDLLIGMDTLVPQGVLIDLHRRVLKQPLCDNAMAPLVVKAKDDNAHKTRKIIAKGDFTIKAKSAMKIPAVAKGTLSADYDYVLEPLSDPPYTTRCYASLVKAGNIEVVMRNDSGIPVRIQDKAPLGHAIPLNAHGVYSIDSSMHDLAALPDLRRAAGNNLKERNAEGTAAPESVHFVGTNNQTADAPQTESPDKTTETRLDNGVTIYGNPKKAGLLIAKVMKHPDLWTDRGTTCRVPEDQRMTIELKDGWQDANVPSKIYAGGPRDRACIDNVFDKLTQQGKMEPAIKQAPFPVPVFVVWKPIVKQHDDGTEYTDYKGRPVLDMREINNWTIKDSYPLTTQNEILSRLQGAKYITVVDGLSFFYQFLVKRDHRYRFTVNTHRGAEILNVCAMGFKNSVAHVQRCGDNMLRDLADFVKAYIDDFVIYSKTFDEHLVHLEAFFDRVYEMGVSLAPAKAFIAYPSVKLLGHRVDAFGIASTDERIAALRNIQFPRHAKDMEKYCGAINFLNDRTPYLAQVAEPLTNLKALLLADVPKKKGRDRTMATVKKTIPATGPIRDAFDNIQSLWSTVFSRTHQDVKRALYIDVDSSKEHGMALMAYHVKGDPEPTMIDSDIPDGYEDDSSSPTAWLKRSLHFEKASIEPVVFLSKCLSGPETRYFPTELEMAGLCWAVKKLRHMIEAAPKVYVFTDHAAVTAIARQRRLTTTESLEGLNLRLAKASVYLQQFTLDVRYRPGKLHLVPDALSRLHPKSIPEKDLQTDMLNDVAHVFHAYKIHPNFIPEKHLQSDIHNGVAHVFHALIVNLDDDFKERLKQSYRDDKLWARVRAVISGERQEHEDPERPMRGLRFLLKDDLIYYWGREDGSERLCIPQAMMHDIFQQAHDGFHHQGFNRTYTRVRTSFFIHHMAKHLRTYIKYCPKCLVNQTQRHLPYGTLEPLDHVAKPYEIVCIDIVTHLPETPEGFNAILTETCHMSKMINIIPGKEDWSGEQWSTALTQRNYITGWGTQRIIISDRAPTFIKGLFSRQHHAMGTKFHTTAAYWPQSDGQSERTNQTVSIAIRFVITEHEQEDDADDQWSWKEVLPHIQFSLNTSKNHSIGCTPYEYLMGFNPHQGFDLLFAQQTLSPEDYKTLRLHYREEAEEALAFAKITQKDYYDRRHQPIELKPGDHAALVLHKGYKMKGNLPKKVGYQRYGPLKVLEKIGKNAFRIERPPGSRIHDVVNASQLEPCHTVEEDPYHRPFPLPRQPLVTQQDGAELKAIERILKRRVNTSTGQLEYLVKWERRTSSHNQWLSTTQLHTAKEMRQDFDAQFPLTEQEVRKQRRFRTQKARQVARDRRQLEASSQEMEPSPETNDNDTRQDGTTHEEQAPPDDDTPVDGEVPEDPSPPRRKKNPRLRDRLNARGIDTIYNPGEQEQREPSDAHPALPLTGDEHDAQGIDTIHNPGEQEQSHPSDALPEASMTGNEHLDPQAPHDKLNNPEQDTPATILPEGRLRTLRPRPQRN